MTSAAMDQVVMEQAVVGAGAAASSPGVAAGAGRVAGVHGAIDVLDVSGLVEGEHAGVLKELERARRRLESASLRVLAAAEKARVGVRAGHTGTGAWVSAQTNVGGAEGAAQSQLAGDLDQRLPAAARPPRRARNPP